MNKLLMGPHADVFTRQHALSSGMTRGQLAWALQRQQLLVLRRGVYCWRTTFEAGDERARHLLHATAAQLSHDERHVLSHVSAALSWDLPVPFDGIGRPSLTLPGAPASTDRQRDLIVQVAALRPQDYSTWRTGRRTSVTRTVVDCLRHLAAPDAVAIADHALHKHRTTVSELEQTMAWQSGWPYAERGRASLSLADARRESPLESWSFVKLHQRGIPLPVAQATVFDTRGAEVARVDGYWPEHATVCEADGRGKYSLGDWSDLATADVKDLYEARMTAAERVVIDEKVREDRLRALGLEVVRWGTADIRRNMAQVLRDIRSAWRRGDPARVSGQILLLATPG